jgi:hypothetical protein
MRIIFIMASIERAFKTQKFGVQDKGEAVKRRFATTNEGSCSGVPSGGGSMY